LFLFFFSYMFPSEVEIRRRLCLLGGLAEKDGVDVGENTTLGNGYGTEKLVELLVVADSKLNVTGDDAALLVIAGSVTGKLEDLGGEVLKDGSKVDGGTGTDTGGVLASLQVATDTSNGELKTGLGSLGGALLASGLSTASLSSFSSSSFSRHFDKLNYST